MDISLIKDIWKNPRGVNELIISIFLFIESKKYLNWVLIPPKLVVKGLFFILPYSPSSTVLMHEEFCSGRVLLPRFISSFIAAFFLCYGVVFLLTALDGRLLPLNGELSAATFLMSGQSSTLVYYTKFNFFDDIANNILYAVVVPTYVALCCQLIFISRNFQAQSSSPNNSEKLFLKTRPNFGVLEKWQLHAIFVLVVLSGVFVTSSYQSDVFQLLSCVNESTCNKTDKPLLYWFLDTKPSGVTYNAAGIYYIALNYGLLILAIISILFFYSCAFSSAGLKKRIEKGEYDDFKILEQDLRPYKLLFVSAKWLLLVLIINTAIWKHSHLGGNEASGSILIVNITILAYGLIGSTLLPIPNYIIQTSWNLRQRTLYLAKIQNGQTAQRVPNCEIFPRGWMSVVKNIANFLIASFSAYSLLSIIENLMGINLWSSFFS